MKKIIFVLFGIIFLASRMSTLAATSCTGKSDCPTGYECVYLDNSDTPRLDSSSGSNAYCAKIYQSVTRVPTKTPTIPKTRCNTLFWFDNNNLTCGKRDFCGAYLYLGLRTFQTLEECEAHLPTPKYAKEGEFCGAGPNGVVNCAPGLRCDESRNIIYDETGKQVGMRIGAGGICVKITPTAKPTIIGDCRLKKCGDANCDGKIDSGDRLIWIRERFGSSRTADFNKDGKIDLKDYSIITSGIRGNCQPVVTPRITTPMPTKKPVTPTATTKKACFSNSDCLSSEYCYQPPMPTCPKGQNCLDVMPRKYCLPKPPVTLIPKPSLPGEVITNVNWETKWANFRASNYQIQAADGTSTGKIFKVNPSKPCNTITGEMVCVDSDSPGLRENGQHYMSLEVTWFEYDVEMRMFIYLYSDGKRWWSDEIRVFNGQSQPNTEWVYFYGKFFDTPIGEDFIQMNQFSLTAPDSKNRNTPVTMKFSNLKFGAFKNYFPQIVTPTPSVHKSTPAQTRSCEMDSDCSRLETCYQPPAPTCAPGQNCLNVMPRKYCKAVIVSEVTGAVEISKCMESKGDANRDGKVNLADYAIWRYQYAKGAVNRADFNCDKKVDTTDYKIWREAFLETRGLLVTEGN